MKIVGHLIIVLIILHGCYPQKPITITKFYTYYKPIDTVISLNKEVVIYNDFFVISNYQNNKKVDNIVDSFVFAYTLEKSGNLNTHEIRCSFFQETEKTNIEAIKQNPREVDRYSFEHDLIYTYTIDSKGNTIRTKYKNGKELEVRPKQIAKPNFEMKMIE